MDTSQPNLRKKRNADYGWESAIGIRESLFFIDKCNGIWFLWHWATWVRNYMESPDSRKCIMCSIVTVDMVRRQNECWQWKIRCALNESSDKFLMEKHCYDISWHRCCCIIINSRRNDIFGNMNNRLSQQDIRISESCITKNK